jgi:NAD(P)-dependent dehydrogenase (short-subunit alcohol dehydrogenase family)
MLEVLGDVDQLPFGATYSISKRLNLAEVETAAVEWGAVGARVVSVSPGLTATAMGRRELDTGASEAIQQQLAETPAQRMGSPEDIAAAVHWLTSEEASYITGCDLRVDGGGVAAAHVNAFAAAARAEQ